MNATATLDAIAIEDSMYGDPQVTDGDNPETLCFCICSCKDGTERSTNSHYLGAVLNVSK